MHALPQSLSPLADSRVNDSLLQIIPHFNEALLQLVDVTYTTFIYSILYLDRMAARGQIQIDEVGCLLLQQMDGVAGAM